MTLTHRLIQEGQACDQVLSIHFLFVLFGASDATMCLTTPATLQVGAQASVQCSQGGFLFCRAC